MELGKIYNDVSINELNVKRAENGFSVSFKLVTADEQMYVKNFGVRDTDDICELLSADRIWIKKNEDSQLEFGSLKLGISQEYYTEITFDAFEV